MIRARSSGNLGKLRRCRHLAGIPLGSPLGPLSPLPYPEHAPLNIWKEILQSGGAAEKRKGRSSENQGFVSLPHPWPAPGRDGIRCVRLPRNYLICLSGMCFQKDRPRLRIVEPSSSECDKLGTKLRIAAQPLSGFPATKFSTLLSFTKMLRSNLFARSAHYFGKKMEAIRDLFQGTTLHLPTHLLLSCGCHDVASLLPVACVSIWALSRPLSPT